ncbi:MAG: FHA domain-containing protein [Anaerolineales bacterium]|nr:FHA domain-containing protein [Chloroflexota bacterium]MBL6981501.1 FHA domain-containing protein [Anaerolineales bacterium]
MATQSFELVMTTGPTPEKKFTLSKQEVIIGRDANADIVINIAEVSRRHTRMRLEPSGYVVEDLGSTNGTFVNGQRLTGPHMLRPGERIQLGEAVTMSYQVAAFDMNATVVTPASGQETVIGAQAPPAASVPPPQPRAMQPPPAQPAYSGHVPQGPAAQIMPQVEEKQGRPWLWAGLGCIGVMICLVVVGAVAFDFMDLYCTPPFNSLLSFLYSCP